MDVWFESGLDVVLVATKIKHMCEILRRLPLALIRLRRKTVDIYLSDLSCNST